MAGIVMIGFSIAVGEVGAGIGATLLAHRTEEATAAPRFTTLRLFQTLVGLEASFLAVAKVREFLVGRQSGAPTAFDYNFMIAYIASHTFTIGCFLPSLLHQTWNGLGPWMAYAICVPLMVLTPLAAIPGVAVVGLFGAWYASRMTTSSLLPGSRRQQSMPHYNILDQEEERQP